MKEPTIEEMQAFRNDVNRHGEALGDFCAGQVDARGREQRGAETRALTLAMARVLGRLIGQQPAEVLATVVAEVSQSYVDATGNDGAVTVEIQQAEDGMVH